MIVAIKGNMNSGKDTLASMIQYCLAEQIIGVQPTMKRYQDFSEFTESGKERLSNSLIITFAKPIERVVAAYLGISVKEVRTRKMKNSYWNPNTGGILSEEEMKLYESANFVGLITNTRQLLSPRLSNHKYFIKIRVLYQFLGTEVGRDIFDNEIWINKCFKDYKLHIGHDNLIALKEPYDVTESDEIAATKQYPLYIIPDLRMINEADKILQLAPNGEVNGKYHHASHVIIELVRETDELQDKLHDSVKEVDCIKSDISFNNSGTLDDLLEFAINLVNLIERP